LNYLVTQKLRFFIVIIKPYLWKLQISGRNPEVEQCNKEPYTFKLKKKAIPPIFSKKRT